MELTAHRIAAHFRGTLRVTPDEDAVVARLAWQERALPGSGGYDLGPYDIHSADEIMHDMGRPARRAGNPFTEHLLPGSVARRYKGLRAP